MEDIQKKSMDMIKAVYEDKEATINGRNYTITKLNHAKRLKIFSFYSVIKQDLAQGNLSFLDTPKWQEIEKIIGDVVLFDGVQINKCKEHWEDENFAEDFMQYVSVMLNVFCYPFFRSSLTN